MKEYIKNHSVTYSLLKGTRLNSIQSFNNSFIQSLTITQSFTEKKRVSQSFLIGRIGR